MLDAPGEAHRRGCNPGGEIEITEIVGAKSIRAVRNNFQFNRLYSRAEIEWVDAHGIGSEHYSENPKTEYLDLPTWHEARKKRDDTPKVSQ